MAKTVSTILRMTETDRERLQAITLYETLSMNKTLVKLLRARYEQLFGDADPSSLVK